MAYFTADIPETIFSFFVMFLLIAASRGARSAATRFEANEFVSIPEPAPSVVVIFAAAALAAVASVVDDAVDVLADAAVEEEETAVTMAYCSIVFKS
jgi:hypothetical protein